MFLNWGDGVCECHKDNQPFTEIMRDYGGQMASHLCIQGPEQQCRRNVTNHKSVLDFPAHIITFLDTGIRDGPLQVRLQGSPSYFKGKCSSIHENYADVRLK